MLPDGIKAASPKAKSQPRKDFLARNELDLSAINLADAAPGFIGAGVRRAVERLNQRKRELGTFHLGQPRCLFLQFCKRLGHMTFIL